MNDLRTPVVQLACALSLALIAQGCREDLGCPPGTVLVGDACEDAPDMGVPMTDMGVSPDGSFNDRDADTDACTQTLYYPDADEDGLGARDADAVSACQAPMGHVANADDCDDTCEVCNDRVEVCDGEDNDCDGDVDEDTAVVCGTDEGVCATGMQQCVGGVLGACGGGVMPAVAEVCEGNLDENCDGEVDEDCECAVNETRPCGLATGECSQGMQTCTADGVFGDCIGAVGPIAEVCNGLDDDCDGVDDNGNPGGGASCGVDTGECEAGTEMCVGGEVVCVGAVGPVDEVCNGRDDDCSGVIDEGVTNTYFLDADRDGRGLPDVSMQACSAPSGYVTNANDCNDGCAVCWTGAAEVCDGFDNNCMGGTDEGVTTRFFADTDSDTYGNPASFVDACAPPLGFVANQSDCDDSCGECWSGRADLCDGLDNDCSGAADETYACVVGASVACTTSCGTTGTGTCSGMCEIPGAVACWPPAEVCNGVDDDCDELIDEGARTLGNVYTGVLGNYAKLERAGSGYVGIQRYNGAARLYATDASGLVTQNPTTVDASDVSSVDIARISDTQWVSASGFGDGAVNVRLLGLSNNAPVVSDVERALSSGTGGIARVAAHSATNAMTVYQAGAAVRVAHVDFAGAVAASVALPGSTPRAELGMDIVALPPGNGYVVAWVSGLTPTVNVALVSAPGMVVTASGALGPGSNPVLAVDNVNWISVAYTGDDGRPRVHKLLGSLTCVSPSGAARNTCGLTTSERVVVNPVGGGTFNRTLDLVDGGEATWLVARTSDGELLQRLYQQAVRYEIFRATTTTSWVSVAARGEAPVVLRGSGAAYTHHATVCAP